VRSYPTIRHYGFGDAKSKSTLKFSTSAEFEDILDEVEEDHAEAPIQSIHQANI
jgi:hypothetical protein